LLCLNTLSIQIVTNFAQTREIKSSQNIWKALIHENNTRKMQII